MMVKLIRERTPILQIGKRLKIHPVSTNQEICEHDSRIVSNEHWPITKVKVMTKELYPSQKVSKWREN